MIYSEIIKLIDDGNLDAAEEMITEIGKIGYNDTIAILDFEVKKGKGASTNELMEIIKRGMECNYENYELYVCLAEVYREKNANQSFLCLEQALHFCTDIDDYSTIHEMINELTMSSEITVPPISIVIASYNCKPMMIENIESIRKTCKNIAYEIITVDNASSDGIAEWLASQEDIISISNMTNTGFGHASNQGVKAANPNNDIFFLNNDIIVPENAIFWLRMGLYSDDKTGAAGSVSNNVKFHQRILLDLNSKEEWMAYAIKNNILQNSPYEIRPSLVGFALLVKREALDKVGLFDEIYGIGNYEDDDLCVRILREGYKSIICKNSFIYHYGSQSFQKDVQEFCELMEINKQLFKNKWGFDITYYSNARDDLIEFISEPKETAIKVLEVGCGMGTTLARIAALWPNAIVKGIEIVESIQKLASIHFDVIRGDIEILNIPYEEEYFDYIICGDVLEHLHNPKNVIDKLKKYLAPTGKIVGSIPNIMHASVLIPLLKGHLEYTDAGILDRTHIKFFTFESIVKMFYDSGMRVERMDGNIIEEELSSEERILVSAISDILGDNFSNDIRTYQYLFMATKM